MSGADRAATAPAGSQPAGMPGISRRLLLEVADARLARRCAALLRQDGFRVTRCRGEGRSGGSCPLLSGSACPLVDRADVVVHALPDDRGQGVLRALRRSDRPVLALTGAGAAPAGQGAVSLAAELVGERLIDEVRRTCASRVRLLAVPLRLRDGRRIRIRAIDPADAELLRKFDGDLSETSRRLRYLGWMAPLSAERASAMAAMDFRDRFALVAITSEGGRPSIVADCRLVPIPEQPGSAEIAIAVADGFQGAGLGRALLELMLHVASDRGLAEVVAEVHYDNAGMMHLLRQLGFRRSAWDLGVATFTTQPKT